MSAFLAPVIQPILSATLNSSGVKPLLHDATSVLANSGIQALLLAIPDWAALGACFALAAAVFLFVFYIHPDASDLAPHRTKLDQLLERRDAIYDNLRDLKFEHRAGKYSEGDYQLMVNSLENEAAMVLTEIEQVTESQVRRARVVRPAAAPERSAR